MPLKLQNFSCLGFGTLVVWVMTGWVAIADTLLMTDLLQFQCVGKSCEKPDTRGTNGGGTMSPPMCSDLGATKPLTLLAPTTFGKATPSKLSIFWIAPENHQSLPTQISLSRVNGDSETNVHTASSLTYLNNDLYVATFEGQDDFKLDMYIVTIKIICNERFPDENLVAESQIQFSNFSLDDQNSLENLGSPFERMSFYAKRGFWYDALAEIINLDKMQEQQAIQILLEDLITQEMKFNPNAPEIDQLEYILAIIANLPPE